MSHAGLATQRGHNPRSILPLLLLFGTLYFVQGIVEPTACLPYQPVQSQLRAWSFSAKEIGHFFGVIGIAWSIKPLFGLVSDFCPIAGRRRRPYLALSTAVTAIAFFGLAALSTTMPIGPSGWFGWLIEASPGQPAVDRSGWLLMLVGFGVAMTDVVIDALAVETGQPRGITGQIQSVQWFALSVAGVLAGVGGGFVAQHGLQRPMFVVCGLLALGSLAVVLFTVREPPDTNPTRQRGVLAARQELSYAHRLWPLLCAAAFLFLWNFNPFSSNVLQEYATKELGFSEQAFGTLLTIQSVGMIAGCLSYGWYCRRVPFGWLVHGSIVAGILSTLGYWLLRDWTTAVIASFLFGLAWQTGLLVQLDLSARICPLQSAGTMFALLMAITNTGSSAGIYLGGGWYDGLVAHFHGDRHFAFHTLVCIGATFTAGCWLLVPLLKRAGVDWN
jgi:predicted MFS family arabinose efflux permease